MTSFQRAAAFAAALTFCAQAAEPAPLQTVQQVDLQRYLGVWHEQARYNSWFQGPDCVNVTAEYGLTEDGKISVLNTCRDAAGAVTDQADGSAYVDDTATNAKLRVSFFWPFFGDYWIVALAEDYSWVIVSEPGREYLWLLTREAKIDPALRDQLLAKAAELGFDTTKLFFSQRPQG
jgi:apolipoprotein D and lipocalin family protein